MTKIANPAGRVARWAQVIGGALGLCLLVLMPASGGERRAGESVNFVFPWKPKLAHQADGPKEYAIFEFVRDGDDINNWQELVTLQNFSKSWGGASPEDALNSLQAIREELCPGQTDWHVIRKDADSVLYEWQAKPCLGGPAQHEIAKILDGEYNRFRLAYTTKTAQLPAEKREQWVKIIAESRVVKN